MKRAGFNFPDLSHEKALWSVGYRHVGGVDEAGRGAWAGPVFAAVVILAERRANEQLLGYIRDSKQMTTSQRQRWIPVIKDISLDWGVAYATNDEIDALGIVPATQLAARRAILNLRKKPDYLLLDYMKPVDVSVCQEALVRGDQQVLSIAAASILAKTTRDEYMVQMDRLFPAYSFSSNKGYGTAVHQNALHKAGICPIHRVGFKPVAKIKNRPALDD